MAMYRNHRQPPKAWTAWLDGWTLDMQARGMSGQTVESYWYRLTSLAIDCATPPNKVTAEQIQAWIVQTPDATTRAGRRGAVNEFYKWAVRMRRVRRNPVDRVPPVRRPKRLAKQPAPEQAVARGLYSPDWKARLMVMLAAEVGLRRGEINLVRGADVVEQDTLQSESRGKRRYGRSTDRIPRTAMAIRLFRSLRRMREALIFCRSCPNIIKGCLVMSTFIARRRFLFRIAFPSTPSRRCICRQRATQQISSPVTIWPYTEQATEQHRHGIVQ